MIVLSGHFLSHLVKEEYIVIGTVPSHIKVEP